MTQIIANELLEGYAKFRSVRYSAEADRFRALAGGQSPKTMVIGCADSRVDPATIFSAAPGELFVVRNVAALVPPCEAGGVYHGTSAALEFAVAELRIERIVVLGHGMCGGVSAALQMADKRPVGQFIGPWVKQLDAVRTEVLANARNCGMEHCQRVLEHEAIKYSLKNLETFAFVRDAVRRGKLDLCGGWFSIAEGELHWLNAATGVFEAVELPTASEG
jgi:carbonic anhydrase